MLRSRSDLGEAVREIEGGGRDREGDAQAEHLVDGRADQKRPVVRCCEPGGEVYLGGGQAQRRRMRPRRSLGDSAASQVTSSGPSGRTETRSPSAPRTPLGMGCAAMLWSGRTCDEIGTSRALMGLVMSS